MEIKYSQEPEDKTSTVKAMGRDYNISFKSTVELCKHLKGMPLTKALKILEKVKEKEYAVPYTRFNKGVGHRKGAGVKIGKFPVKVARHVEMVLKNLEANAEFKGMDAQNITITSLNAIKGRAIQKRRPKGRWKVWNTQYVHIQAIGQEVN
ncbi:MAG TPA: 50S ribosomal protein L22 [Candidatus Altiarchaeales archaeon]|nr:50S ribosomal protein L22 [Candidatus Altiarchaeales archaeon]